MKFFPSGFFLPNSDALQKNPRKKRTAVWLVCLLFGLIYSLISLVNHYNFRTYALDLGLYTNAAYKYANFQLADSLMIKEFYEPLLGGHFDLYLLICSPFILVFKSYTLLIIQIFSLIIGGLGVHRYFVVTKRGNSNTPMLAMIFFFSFYGVFSAIAFDYHSTVVASSIVPWLFVSIHENKKIRSVLLLLLILISQENTSFWMFFVTGSLMIEYKKDKDKLVFLFCLSMISLIYFLTIIHVVIPVFSKQNQYTGFLFSVLGDNVFEAIKTILFNPLHALGSLFKNHTGTVEGDYVKIETLCILFFSGMFWLVRKPQYLIMILPVLFQKFFHDNQNMWGVGLQYNIEFAPILSIGIFNSIFSTFNHRQAAICSFITWVFCVASTARTMDNTVFWFNKAQIRFYQKKHYTKKYNVRDAHKLLSNIPPHANISAQSPFVPHLCLRKTIYQFPIIKDAQYIVYSREEGPYPISPNDFAFIVDSLDRSNCWIKECDNGLVILRKK
jgi:uncharacterized membrane protein